ncbi:MAG: peptidylprolyl isomerase [Candidatus Eisenbacteria bacterium]|nr:peptidylprolyl isomerase [Candidatus Eisenbacteria bacterium]
METEEGTDVVTATLTIIPKGKVGTGERKQMEVPYLPPGRKIATLETTKGEIRIELWEDEAPNTVTNFAYLANTGKYDGVEFHRVLPGFMAQTGDVENKGGTGGPGYNIPAEFNKDLKHERGVVSMARAGHPDSAGSQFFIMFAASPHLDGQYAAFGKVIEGMDVVDSLNTGEPPSNPDKIQKARVESVPEK